MKKIFKNFLFVLYFIFCASEIVESKHGKKPSPHIVFIIADDMGWNDVSFHGADQIPTPNIDALAYNGVILNRHYVNPTCTPSRSALLTGRYAIRSGMQGSPLRIGEPRGLPLNVTLLPEFLRRLGYRTQLLGKWHLGYVSESYTPARRGFDTFLGYYNGYISYFNYTTSLRDSQKTHVGYDFHYDDENFLNVAKKSSYFTDAITDKAVKVIKRNRNKEPLYLQISHLAVHTSGTSEPLEVRNMTEVNETFPYIKDLERRKYAGMVKALDESVGRVVSALREAEMLNNSIIIFISDNGAPYDRSVYKNSGSNYPLRGAKHSIFEGGVRGVACIFSPLIQEPSRVSEELMHITDWLPTLYAAAGGDSSNLAFADLDGINQWPSIVRSKDKLLYSRSSVLVNIDEITGAEAAIIGRYKLVKGQQKIDSYYGESGNGPSYPKYHVKDALSSAAGESIGSLKGFSGTTIEQAQRMRRDSTVECYFTLNINPPKCNDICLFDLYNDSCEREDLSNKYPEIVEELKSLIDGYRNSTVPQLIVPVDPESYPENFNGVWMPWRKEE